MPEQIKICHISTVHRAFDDRIFYKQCRSLAANGYDVTLIVEHTCNEVVDGVNIVALPFVTSRIQRFFFNSFRAFYKGIKSGARLIHFHDPELIIIGLLFRICGRKVIYDVHELVYYHFEQKDWLNPVLKRMAKSIYQLSEKLAVHFFNKIILVVDDHSFRDYFTKNYPNHSSRFVYIRNFSIISFIDKISPAVVPATDSIVIYAGGLSRIRGIREIIQAIGEMKIPPVLILFGEWSDEEYKRECMTEPGWKQVNYMGYRKLEIVYQYMKVADLGIALLYPMKNYLTSLPVKAFEYMACSVPILISDFPFWKKIFNEGAWFTDPLDVGMIREKLENILADRIEMKKKGEAGRRLVEREFSWEAESIRFLECYKEVLS